MRMSRTLWKDGILVMLRMANEASNVGQPGIAKSLIVTALAAIREARA